MTTTPHNPSHADLAQLRVWLVHDWLTGFRGGEKLLLELVHMFPHARIATLLHIPGSSHPDIDARVERVSFLQKLPGAARGYRNYLPLFPRAVRSLHLDEPCDLVLSVSHAVAKGIAIPAGRPHLCYCNTPMRYIWGLEDQYVSRWSPKRFALKMATPSLRRFDRKNESITEFIGNSKNVADRIRRFYGRDAGVVYPGIDEAFYTLSDKPRENFYLVVSALVPYKRVDLAIRACLPLSGQKPRKLIVIGKGPDDKKLRQLANGAANITFLGRQEDDVLRDHYQRCAAFLFPGEEDFGLTPVEAQACGAPVIAYHAGGALETIVDGQTGLFFSEQTVSSLQAALLKFESRSSPLDSAILRNQAMHFTMRHFREGIYAAVARLIDKL